MRRALRLLGELISVPLGLGAALGLIDALRKLPGPSLALTLPLRETGHQDRASALVVLVACALVFGLSALALDPSRRARGTTLLRTAGVLACALALQAVSLQLVRQASLGLDWGAALRSPAPFVCALGALLGTLAASALASSDRRRLYGPKERPVDGRANDPPLAKIVP